MGLERKDYIMRQIRELAAMLARIAGLRVEGNFAEAAAELQAAYHGLLGPDPSLLLNLDAETVALLLRDDDKLIMLAQVVHEESKFLRATADPRAAVSEDRAFRLALEALRRDADSREAARIVTELAPAADETTLAEWQRELVRRTLP